MDIYRSTDKQVAKFIHMDGSETCIKTVYSVESEPGPRTDYSKKTVFVDRNKYSVFVSASRGCPFSCSFCYLTIDDVQFGKLTYEQIIQNVKDAILDEAKHSDLSDRFIKLCWMGMGEPIIIPNLIHDGTIEILEWVMKNNLARGLDGVDVSTILPKRKGWVAEFDKLNKNLECYPLNPNNKNVVNKEEGTLVEYENRSRFRLFYSLHSGDENTRKQMVPNAVSIQTAATELNELATHGIDVIVHQLFLDGMNDSDEEVELVADYMVNSLPSCELRVLRYNKHEKSPIKESTRFRQCISKLYKYDLKLKVQVSYGLEVKSACGQFINKNTEKVHQFKESL